MNRNSSYRRTRRPSWRSEQPRFSDELPSFGQWLKWNWVDLATMAVMGAIGMIVYKLRPVPSRSFAVTSHNGEVVYPEFAYPERAMIVPIWAATLYASAIPIAVILLMQIRTRSFMDANNGIMGLLYSLITAAVFQAFLKWLIGGLRPHFLTICKPDLSLAKTVVGGDGFGNLYYTSEVCTGNTRDVEDSLESFPSGHSTAAFAGFVYLSLYLNGKLKVFADHRSPMWKLIVLYAPILIAMLIAGSLTIDGFHNWYDVLAGGLLGTMMAFSSYRMMYVSLWDWTTNHIPLQHSSICADGPRSEGGDQDEPYSREPQERYRD